MSAITTWVFKCCAREQIIQSLEELVIFVWLKRYILLCVFCHVCSPLYLFCFISWDPMEKNRYLFSVCHTLLLWLFAVLLSVFPAFSQMLHPILLWFFSCLSLQPLSFHYKPFKHRHKDTHLLIPLWLFFVLVCHSVRPDNVKATVVNGDKH